MDMRLPLGTGGPGRTRPLLGVIGVIGVIGG
jgi:hypothetical protein